MYAHRLGGYVAITDSAKSERNRSVGESRLQELSQRLRPPRETDWPAKLRWIAAVAAAGVCALIRLAEPRSLPDGVLAFVAAFVLAYGVALSPRRSPESTAATRRLGLRRFAILELDLTALSLLILFSAGVHSPLVPFLVLPIVMAPFMVSPLSAYISALAASILLGAVAMLSEFAAPLTSSVGAMAGSAPAPRWHPTADLASWTLVFLLTAALAASAASRITSGRRQLGEARSQLERQSGELAEANLRLEKLIAAR